MNSLYVVVSSSSCHLAPPPPAASAVESTAETAGCSAARTSSSFSTAPSPSLPEKSYLYSIRSWFGSSSWSPQNGDGASSDELSETGREVRVVIGWQQFKSRCTSILGQRNTEKLGFGSDVYIAQTKNLSDSYGELQTSLLCYPPRGMAIIVSFISGLSCTKFLAENCRRHFSISYP